MHFPREFIIRRDIHAIQHFGQNLLEAIPAPEIIRAERRAAYSRMIEAVWNEKQYLIFERDLAERAEPVGSVDEGPEEPVGANAALSRF